MKDHTRRAIAYIVLRFSSGHPLPGLHDHACAKGFRFDGDISPNKTKISVFDHAQQCHIRGAGGAGFYTLTHEGNGKPISLKMKANQFEGFDYDSGKPYSGKVSGRSVSIHDVEHDRTFQYS